MKVLYIENDPNIRDLYQMKLEADFQAEVSEAETEEEALKLLQKDSNWQMVLIDIALLNKSGSTIYQFILDNSLNIPFIIISDRDLRDYKGLENFRKEHPGNRLIQRPINEKVFKTVLESSLADTNKITGNFYNPNGFNTSPTEYTPVRIRNFTRFNSLPCEVFIKLSEDKFLKLINANDIYSSEVINKYIEKKVAFLFVRSNDYQVLADTGIRTLLELYDRKPKGEDIQKLQLMAIEDLHHKIAEFNVDQEVVQLTKKTVETSIDVIKRFRNVADLLSKIKNHGDYIYDHSLKLSYLCIAIAKRTEWNSDNTCFKLSLAAMMHDMTLNNNHLARIESLDDPALKNFSEEEREAFLHHPSNASKLIRENKFLPSDIDFIVLEHHERPDGKGFPRGLSKNRISSLGCVFILAHQFLNIMERLGGEYTHTNLGIAFDELTNSSYSLGNFKVPYQGLLNTFL